MMKNENMAKRRIARREGFEKCLIPWIELNNITKKHFVKIFENLVRIRKKYGEKCPIGCALFHIC